MAKTKRDIGAEILEGIREIKRGEHGRVITVPSITSIREAAELSQSRFAQLLGVSVRTLQEWEQGRRAPSGAAQTLLRMAAQDPRKVRALWLAVDRRKGRELPALAGEDEGGDAVVVRVPKALHQRLRIRARREAVSLNHLIVRLLAARIAAAQPPEEVPSRAAARRGEKPRLRARRGG